MIPGALEEARVPELPAAQHDLFFADRVVLADLQRHVLPVGVLLAIIDVPQALDESLADRTPALARADVDQDAVVVEADAAMAVVVDDIGLLQHADAVDELCFELGLRYGLAYLLHCGLGHDTSPSIIVTSLPGCGPGCATGPRRACRRPG